MTRDKYTWQEATKDLALTTSLTLRESTDLTYELSKMSELHPYDAMPLLSRIVVGVKQNSFSEVAHALALLLAIAEASSQDLRLQERRSRLGDLNFTRPPTHTK